jgi:hypothetical protein
LQLQQKAVSHIPDSVATPKIALDGWTGHTRSAVHQQSTVLQSHTNTTPTQQLHHYQHHQQHTVITSSPQPTDPPGHHDGKHSLLQFAMLHFRQSPEKLVLVPKVILVAVFCGLRCLYSVIILISALCSVLVKVSIASPTMFIVKITLRYPNMIVSTYIEMSELV